MILADTSAVIALLNGRPTVAAKHLEILIQEGEAIGFPASVVQEVLQGARDEREWRLLLRYFDSQHIIGAAPETYRRAARIYVDCRRRGLTIRNGTDCLIAQVALDHRQFLVADDRDFESIRQVRPLKLVTSVTLDEAIDDK
jgi:predicted nucleic acid-binding protein